MRAKRPPAPRKIKSSYVKQRVRFDIAVVSGDQYIPAEQGQRFIKNYNYNLAQMYKKYPETKNEKIQQLEEMGLETTKSGLIRYTERTNTALIELGYGSDRIDILSAEGMRRFQRNNERLMETRPIGEVYADRLYVERASKRLETFYADYREDYGDINGKLARAKLRSIAPKLVRQDIKSKMTYAELRKQFERLIKAGLI